MRWLGELVQRRIVRSEIEGGLWLRALRDGDRVVVETLHHRYELEMRGTETWISGHPRFCPGPVPVRVHGSSWGGSMLKRAYIGRGMQLEFEHPEFATVITSRICAIRTLA